MMTSLKLRQINGLAEIEKALILGSKVVFTEACRLDFPLRFCGLKNNRYEEFEMGIIQTQTFFQDVFYGIKAGRFVNAPFNRNYVWNRNDVLALFESIKRNYPLGNFLTWTCPSEEAEMFPMSAARLGPISPNEESSTFIVDGHNRLASFAWALSSLPQDGGYDCRSLSESENDTWFGDGKIFMLDAASMRFDFLTPGHEELNNYIPVHRLLARDYTKYILSRKEAAFSDKALFNMDLFQEKVRSAKVIVTNLDMPAGEALHAFLHLNRAGHPLSEDDMEKALSFFLGRR